MKFSHSSTSMATAQAADSWCSDTITFLRGDIVPDGKDPARFVHKISSFELRDGLLFHRPNQPSTIMMALHLDAEPFSWSCHLPCVEP